MKHDEKQKLFDRYTTDPVWFQVDLIEQLKTLADSNCELCNILINGEYK